MASLQHSKSISLTQVETTAPVNFENVPAGQLFVQTTGPFDGTAVLEVSLDGVTFKASAASPLVAGDYKVIPELAMEVRVDVTAFTSGTLVVRFAGHNPQ